MCVNDLRDAIAGAPRGVNVCDTRGRLGLGLVKICFVVGYVFGFLVMFCFVC